ncbi:MAG: hypothetical protein AAF797_12970 [Planctomycetota bacterium]
MTIRTPSGTTPFSPRVSFTLAALLVLGLVTCLIGCQETRREDKGFGPPSIGGPPRSGGPGADAGEPELAAPDLILASSGISMGETEVDRKAEREMALVLGSFENPVRADGIAGLQTYLNRLRNAAGEQVVFRRAGTFLAKDGTPLDGFRLFDPDTGGEQLVFLDLHHPGHRETQAIPGYRLVPAEATATRDER